MFNLAQLLNDVNVMKGYGVTGLTKVGVNFAQFKAKRDAYIQSLLKSEAESIEQEANITFLEGTASFI